MSERRQRLIRVLESLCCDLDAHVQRKAGDRTRGKFEFNEEELIVLRDACREERQRLFGR